MSFISFWKKLFNKNIELESSAEDNLLYFYNKHSGIKLSHNIVVSDNFTAITVVRANPCDVIYPGKFKINESLIPIAYKKSGVAKRIQQGKIISTINCDLYYVNKRQFNEVIFESDFPFLFNKTQFGKVRGFCEGRFNVVVTDPMLFMSALLREKSKISDVECKRIIGLWVGNEINSLLERSNFDFEEILVNHSEVNNYANSELVHTFEDVGLIITDIKVLAIKVAKKLQNRIQQFVMANREFSKEFSNSVDVANCKTNSVDYDGFEDE